MMLAAPVPGLSPAKGLRDRPQKWLISLDAGIASRFPRKSPVPIRPHQLKTGERPGRFAVKPDRRSQISIIQLQGHLDEAHLAVDENVGRDIAIDVFLSLGSIIANDVDDRGGLGWGYAEYDNLGLPVVERQADRKGIRRRILFGRHSQDVAAALANIADQYFVGFFLGFW